MLRFFTLFLTCLCLFTASEVACQGNVGIGTSAPDTSAILDIQSDGKGLLIPRLTTAQRTAIATPAPGLLVYDSDLKIIMHYDGTVWASSSLVIPELISDVDGDTKVQTEESADEDVIRFDVAGVEFAAMDGKTFGIGTADSSLFIGFDAGMHDDGSSNDNTFVGSGAGRENISGIENTVLGRSALRTNTSGGQNTAIGFESMLSNSFGSTNTAVGNRTLYENASGSYNVAVGNGSLYKNIDGFSNTAIGVAAMESNISGNSNVALGLSALYANTTGSRNVALGPEALLENKDGKANVAIGNAALANCDSISHTIAIGDSALFWNGAGVNPSYEGVQNVAIGSKALFANTQGSGNMAMGFNALVSNTTGDNNTAIGSYTLGDNTWGSFNIAIGRGVLSNNTEGQHNIALGDIAMLQNTTGGSNVALGHWALGSNTTGGGNIALGYQAAFQNISGYSNIALGGGALEESATGNLNIAIGSHALAQQDGISGTVAIGDHALFYNKSSGNSDSGTRNTAVGTSALWTNWYGFQNTSMGYEAMKLAGNGSRNTAVGSQALHVNGGAHDNTAIGAQVLMNNAGGSRNATIGSSAMLNHITGSDNVALGYNTLFNDTTGVSNTAIGSSAGFSNYDGQSSTLIGFETDYHNTSSLNNVMIGYQAGKGAAPHTKSGNVFIGVQAGFNETGSNKLYIENSSAGDPLLYGEFDNDILRVNGELQINGLYAFPAADGSVNQVLRTNGSGELSWVDPEWKILKDGDGDTRIEVEKTMDDDKITFSSGGTECFVMAGSRLEAPGGGASVFFGNGAGINDDLSLNYNTFIGNHAGESNVNGFENTYLGNYAGRTNSSGSGNVFIGNLAGYHELGSNRLYVANDTLTDPLIYGEFDNDVVQINGELRLGKSTGDEMTIVNGNEWTWGASSLNFGNGGDHFIVASQQSSVESAGIYGDGNNLTLWSPGDQAPGQPSALLYLLDEDLFVDADSDPYNNGALKAYVAETGVWTVSDQRKKNTIKPMSNSLAKILQMQGYTYRYNQDEEERRKSAQSREAAGLMAQELEQVFPQAVDRNDDGEYFVNTNMLIPVLIEAIKEQESSIRDLRTQNETLQAQLSAIAERMDSQGHN